MPLRSAAALIAAVAALALLTPAAFAVPHLSQIGSFRAPVYVTAPPADPHRVFVVEQGGTIMVVRDGHKLDAPFLDIMTIVKAGGEQGLLSMAFAPDYATSGRFYVYYTAPFGSDPGNVITVDEFRMASGNPDAADPATRRNIFTVDHPTNTNHNGGQLQFGPDGLLYAGTGDGGSGNDPPNNAQTGTSRLGKMLRVNPLSAGAANPQIYASGLRNPFRFSFDRQTGDLIIGDVGQSQREEVDFTPAGTPAGINYGWRCWEGTIQTPGISPACDPPGHVPPLLEKNHGTDGYRAIIGGYVVRDPGLPELNGRYVYGDNAALPIRSVVLTQPGTSDADTGLTVFHLTSFGEDSCGHVYAASGDGPVYRIDGDGFTPCQEPSPPGQPPVLCNGLPATIVGDNDGNAIFGTPGNDVIHGLAGNDNIAGLDGNDVICGGPGRDRLSGNSGNDKLFGGAGNDVLKGRAGKDRLFGQRGNDAMDGQSGFDRCDGGSGIDKATRCEKTTRIP